jgi:hypothetical protein
MRHEKRGCSAAQIRRVSGLANGNGLLMCHKIRSAMGVYETQYLTDGYIEMDDAFSAHTATNIPILLFPLSA